MIKKLYNEELRNLYSSYKGGQENPILKNILTADNTSEKSKSYIHFVCLSLCVFIVKFVMIHLTSSLKQ